MLGSDIPALEQAKFMPDNSRHPRIKALFRRTALPLAVLAFGATVAGGAMAGVTVREDFRFYTIDGASPDEVKKSVSRNVPLSLGKRAWAFAVWNVTWTYTPVSLPDRCWATQVEIEVQARITFPRHRNPDVMDAAMRAKWDGMMAALYRHEKQHVQHGIDAANAMEPLILALREPDCSTLERKINAVAYGQLKEGNERDKRYDAETDHGRLEGTWFE